MKTGFFFEKSSNEYILIWKGEEIRRYTSVEEFVDEHYELLELLQTSQEALLESYYKGTV